jgi:hypothetical protein
MSVFATRRPTENRVLEFAGSLLAFCFVAISALHLLEELFRF